MRIVGYVPDLMDRSRLGGRVECVATPAELVDLADDVDLVVVDLGRPGVLDVLGEIRPHTIGFGSHVDAELLDAARRAGCDEVLARSVFFRRITELTDPGGG